MIGQVHLCVCVCVFSVHLVCWTKGVEALSRSGLVCPSPVRLAFLSGHFLVPPLAPPWVTFSFFSRAGGRQQWQLINPIFYTLTIPSPPPAPSLGEHTAPNAIIDITSGNSERLVGPEGRETGHSCYVNASSDRGR